MTEPTQKEMIRTIVKDVKHIKDKQDDMKIKQDSMDLRLNDIDVKLRGTSFDKQGMVGQVDQNTEDIASIKKRQYKITTFAVVIITSANLLFIGIKELLSKG